MEYQDDLKGSEHKENVNGEALSPKEIAQLVKASSQYTKVAGSISHQGTYKNQLMNAYISGTTN